MQCESVVKAQKIVVRCCHYLGGVVWELSRRKLTLFKSDNPESYSAKSKSGFGFWFSLFHLRIGRYVGKMAIINTPRNYEYCPIQCFFIGSQIYH